jgi:glycosyltransferase involved in cell wall biosynthesis
MPPTVRMLGTRGVPANHGGFETAAEKIALHLVEQGWRVVVYCQTDNHSGTASGDTWKGIERVLLPGRYSGPMGTVWFDLQSIRHACRFDDLCLTFGYNTAILNALQRMRRVPNVINMDGIEWKRSRWGIKKQAYFYINERFASRVGTHLIADHPEIQRYLRRKVPAERITMIAYGADEVVSAPSEPVTELGLVPGEYLTLIARPIAENSILEVVSTFSRRKRGLKLLVLGNYSPEVDEYHRAVVSAGSDEVVFPGAIYEPERVQALRFHSLAYVHGHTVGGTNPSLVEALGCGNPVLAHDNVYNRWVAQDAGLYFQTENEFERILDELSSSPDLRTQLAENARARHLAAFTWPRVAGQYESLLRDHLPGGQARP